MNSNGNNRNGRNGRDQDRRGERDRGYERGYEREYDREYNGLQTDRASSGERFNVHISDEDFRREISRAPKHEPQRAPRREQRYESEARAAAQERKPKQKNGCLSTVAYAALVLGLSCLLSFYAIIGLNDMFGLVKEDVNIDIDLPKDSSLSDVTKILKENEVIDYPFFFKLYSQFSNDRPFNHGHYTLNSKSDYDMIIRKLTRPPEYDKTRNTITVVIPEGKNLMQIAEILEDKCVCSADSFFSVLESHEWKHGFYQSIPKADNETTRKEKAAADASGEPYKPIYQDRLYAMEGYLFPSTYDFYIDENPLYAINRMLNGFDNRVINNQDLDFANRTAALNEKYGAAVSKTVIRNIDGVTGSAIDMDFIITLASVIEREAREPEDMKNVASVFFNRLLHPDYDGIGGRLQSDATLWYPYATKEAMEESSLSEKEKRSFVSAYSTLERIGLPPGPICCPGLNSINAALSPNETKYYYFFSDSEGVFHFSRNIDEHNSLRSQYNI